MINRRFGVMVSEDNVISGLLLSLSSPLLLETLTALRARSNQDARDKVMKKTMLMMITLMMMLVGYVGVYHIGLAPKRKHISACL